MRLFFIYDTAYCRAEEDDPKDAVLYFFPTQPHANQFYSLCCQIVGVAKFFRATFSSPSLIVLDQEKFALYWSGKYLFVLGGRLDIHRNVLKRQLRFLCGIFCFYHGSIDNLLKTCNNDREEFLIKMELAWSRYITLTQLFDNLLQLPVNALPLTFVKKHVEAITKANQLLHMCQMSSSVIAGAVFCNNRVLSSQLTPELSSYLTLMSNENAASPVRNVKTSTFLPPDVELKYVYLSQKVVQGIVRYNHVHAGSSVRVKMTGKLSRSHSHYESLSSGSEGDVDSGNCTEICHHRKEPTELNAMKIKKPPCLELCFRTQLLCCSLHSTVFKKDLLKSQNETFLRYINSEFISEKLKIFQKKTTTTTSVNINVKRKWKQKMEKEVNNSEQVPSFNLPCHRHTGVFSTNFITKSTSKHMDLSSTCDLEYSCYYCINHQSANHITSVSLKSWNSDMHIPDYLHHIPLKSSLECNFAKKLKKAKASKCRIQVLKCRVKSCNSSHHEDPPKLHLDHVKKPTYENILFGFKSKTSKHQVFHVPQNVCDIERYWENMENNKLEKNVLYVQRCGTNMLLLLLNRNYDESNFTYLWNCGFTFLQDLSYEADKKVEEGNEIDPMHYILMYDNVQKVLKERPQYQSSTFSEKHLREAVQNIQEDFQSNSKLHVVSLLSASQAIYACQTKQQSVFYLQQDQNSRKPESLCNLSKKAVRRLERYMKFSA